MEVGGGGAGGGGGGGGGVNFCLCYHEIEQLLSGVRVWKRKKKASFLVPTDRSCLYSSRFVLMACSLFGTLNKNSVAVVTYINNGTSRKKQKTKQTKGNL